MTQASRSVDGFGPRWLTYLLGRSICRSLGYIADQWVQIVVGLLSAALVGAVTTGSAKVVEILIDDVLTQGRYERLNLCIVLILSIHFGKGLFLYISRYLLQKVGHCAAQRLRSDLYSHVLRLSLGYFHQNRTGQIIARMTGDVMVLQNLLGVLARSVNDVFQIFFGVFLMFWIQWKLATATFFILPALYLLVTKFTKRLRAIGSLMQSRIGDISTATHETVLGIKEIQSFGMEERAIRRFAETNEDNYRVNMKGTQYNAITQPIVEMFHAFGIGIVVWYGSVFVIRHTITAGELMGFIACLGMIFHPVKTITEVGNLVRQSEAAADRIFELLDEEVAVESRPGAKELARCEGSVRFDRVSFWYNDETRPVVKDLSLDIAPGEVVALVGHSGAGKSTLVHLLPRFYDVRAGSILVDGVDVRDVELHSLRRHFGLVPQETILFAGSIEENIGFGRPDAGPEEIRRAAADANALVFIDKLPEGFATQIGERGVRLSGGEKQRIAIARAILKDPRILILDEATSSLDTESERLVQEALERLMKNRTTFVIAHRLSTVVHAHKIIVLEGGRVMEVGTHDQLFERKGIYHRLCRAQFKAA